MLGRFGPLATDQFFANERLDEDQRRAVEHILQSRDFITLFRGGAGTRKTYALLEVHEGLQRAGRSIWVIAPQRQQRGSSAHLSQGRGREKTSHRHLPFGHGRRTTSTFRSAEPQPLPTRLAFV